MRHDWKPETIAAQGGGIIDPATGAIVPPIHVATTFVRDTDNQYRRGLFNQFPSLVGPTPSDTIAGTRLPLMLGTAKRSVY